MIEKKEKLTVTLEKSLLDDIEEITENENRSRSEVVRTALEFYFKNENLRSMEDNKLEEYIDLLENKDHIILDMDRWLVFLEQINIDDEEFKNKNRRISETHTSEFYPKIKNFEDLLRRLERCNLFKLNKTSDDNYTIATDSKAVEFIERVILDYADALGFDIETEKSLSKIRVRV